MNKYGLMHLHTNPNSAMWLFAHPAQIHYLLKGVMNCYFLSCFDPSSSKRSGMDCKLGSKRPLLWLANSCVCLTVYILHIWTLMWFRIKTHKYLVHIKRSVITDKAIVLLTLMFCEIGSNIVGTASSLKVSTSENPASNCALFVN